MGRMGIAVLAATVLAAPAHADDVYSWKDQRGVTTFSNAPTQGAQQADIRWEDSPAPDDVAPASATSELTPDESIRKDDLQRELKALDQQVKSLDGRLAELAAARTSHARGLAITGGLGTNAGRYLSPEEESLGAEREKLVDQVEKLRDEIASVGAPPPEAAPEPEVVLPSTDVPAE